MYQAHIDEISLYCSVSGFGFWFFLPYFYNRGTIALFLHFLFFSVNTLNLRIKTFLHTKSGIWQISKQTVWPRFRSVLFFARDKFSENHFTYWPNFIHISVHPKGSSMSLKFVIKARSLHSRIDKKNTVLILIKQCSGSFLSRLVSVVWQKCFLTFECTLSQNTVPSYWQPLKR